MDAVVLVGGEGTRLRPLTNDVPKQMLPVVDRPMIEHVVEGLAEHGIDRVVLSLGYRPGVFSEAFSSEEIAGARLVFAAEPEPLDTAGAIRFAARSAGVRETFVVQNGDNLCDFDIGALVSFHRERRATATIQLTAVEDPSSFGVVVTDSDGRVSAFIEKPPAASAPSNRVNAGLYVLEPKVLDEIAEGRKVSIEREVFPSLARKGSLYATVSSAYWLDTGTPEKYLTASLDVLSGRRPERALPRVPLLREGVFSSETAILESEVEPPCFIGSGAHVAPGARLRGAVVSKGTSVGSGAVVTDAILLAGCKVGEGAVVDHSIIGEGAVLGAGCKVTGYSVVGPHVVLSAGESLLAQRVPPL